MSVPKDVFVSTFRSGLGRLMHLSMRGFWRYARARGLSLTQVFALRHIHYKGQCNISDIGAALGVSNAAASQLLDRLVQDGLILRQEDPQDRRNKLLTLTDAGRQILHESITARQEWLETLYNNLEEEESETVHKAFRILLEKTPLSGDVQSPKEKRTKYL